ncbi:hypothetical protein [uncultured Nocardioides sp.]|uniref:hypothetical protein n=1 Tax=uncultured Nocardioides sp. TaxID=198441 RepID=UPI002602747B|nr:hypothetical protein [uncultured Nocardioides sp.]
MTGSDRPRPGWDLALASLLLDGSTPNAAQAASVTERTVRRWLADDDFRALYRARARAAAESATSDLLSAQREAVQALREGMRSGSPATRVRAARAVLEVAQRVTADEIDQRLTDLERRASGWTDPDVISHGSRGWSA